MQPVIPDGITLRPAGAADAEALLNIYGPIVSDTTISFETAVPTASEFAGRIDNALAQHQWLVADSADGIVGYAYGTAHRARQAYRYAVETSVYVATQAHGRGIARLLYLQLFEDLAALGYFHAFAGITMPNEPSVAAHRALGFTSIGTFPNVGFKHGQWHDVSWWHRPLRAGYPDAEPGRAGSGALPGVVS